MALLFMPHEFRTTTNFEIDAFVEFLVKPSSNRFSPAEGA